MYFRSCFSMFVCFMWFYMYFCICVLLFHTFPIFFIFSYTGNIHGDIRGHTNIHGYIYVSWACFLDFCSCACMSIVFWDMFVYFMCVVISCFVYLPYTLIPFHICSLISVYWTYTWRHPWTCKYSRIYLQIYACELGLFPRFLLVLHVLSHFF